MDFWARWPLPSDQVSTKKLLWSDSKGPMRQQQRRHTNVLSQGCVLVLLSKHRESVQSHHAGCRSTCTVELVSKKEKSTLLTHGKHILSLLSGGFQSHLQSPASPKSSCECCDPSDTPFAQSLRGRNILSRAAGNLHLSSMANQPVPMGECEGLQPLALQLEKLKASEDLPQNLCC